MGGKDGCRERLRTATMPDILYLYGQRILFLSVRESQGILKSDVLGYHIKSLGYIVVAKLLSCFKNLVVVFFFCSCLTIMKHQRKEQSWPIRN